MALVYYYGNYENDYLSEEINMRHEYSIRIEWKDPVTESAAAITEQTAKGRSPVEAYSVIMRRKVSKELIAGVYSISCQL